LKSLGFINQMRYYSLLLLSLTFALKVNAQTRWHEHNSPITTDLHNVFFVSDSTGWIVSHNTGTILHTKDGGDRWFVQAQLDSMYLEDIYFLDRNTGWISGKNGLIFKTDNGGESWDKHKIADKKSWIYSVLFFNHTNGLAVGLQEEKPFTLLLKTTDGGRNWKNLSEKVPRSFYAPISFIDDKKGYIGGFKYIIYTSDGGNTWDMQFSNTSSSECREAIRGLTFITPESGWAVGHCGLVLKTEDGKNWNRVKKFTKNRLRDISFSNESEGYIVGDSNKEPGVLYHTTDGGKKWTNTLVDTPDLHRIELTQNKVWLVGGKGTILSKPR
jgi:photosystem II stability/assembly factor-like uncharacterized protein